MSGPVQGGWGGERCRAGQHLAHSLLAPVRGPQPPGVRPPAPPGQSNHLPGPGHRQVPVLVSSHLPGMIRCILNLHLQQPT